MSTPPDPQNAAPGPHPGTTDPPGQPAAASSPAAPRAGVPRWLVITIVAVVLIAGGAVAFLAFTRDGGSPTVAPAPEGLPPADVTTIIMGPVAMVTPTQVNLDNNAYTTANSTCLYANPAERFSGVEPTFFLACRFSATLEGQPPPEPQPLTGRDIIVTPTSLTISEGAAVLLNREGCPATTSPVVLPRPGTPPGPPIVCVRSTDGGLFAVYVTASTEDGPTIAVARLP